MGSEISSERSKNAQALRELQESFRKKKQELKEEGEQELEATRTDNRTKIAKEKNSSAAVVNHLKEDTKDRTEQMKDTTDKKIIYERKATSQRYESEKSANLSKLEGLQKALETKQASLEKIQMDLHNRQSELRQKESEDTSVIQKEQVERRQQFAKASSQEMQEINARTQKGKTDLQLKNEDEVRKMSEQHRTLSETTKKQNQDNYNRLREFDRAQLKNQQESSNKRLETQRQEFLAKQEGQKKLVTESIQTVTHEGEQKLTAAQVENRKLIEQERLNGAKGIEDTRKVYTEEIARRHKLGDAGVATEKNSHEFKMNRLVDDQKREFEQIDRKHKQDLLDLDQRFKTEAQRNSGFYKEALLSRQKEYENAQNKSLEAFSAHIQLEKENMVKSLEKEKREALDTVGKYRNQQNDPFYRLNKATAQVSETDTHYFIKAEVPEHEKDNVKLFVHDDKAVIQGHRKFQDEINEPEGRLNTSNYQTFRQEIPLERPVHEKLVKRTWENGILTLKIPKV